MAAAAARDLLSIFGIYSYSFSMQLINLEVEPLKFCKSIYSKPRATLSEQYTVLKTHFDLNLSYRFGGEISARYHFPIPWQMPPLPLFPHQGGIPHLSANTNNRKWQDLD